METHNELNIVLTGMPGAGKTYIGKKLAKLLAHFSYIDVDMEIEKREGISIEEIFSTKSEKYFREKESEIIEEFSSKKNQIIAIGGGALQNNQNLDNLKKNSLIFYLKASIGELYSRIKNEKHRPLFKDDISPLIIKDMLKNREKQYKKAHFTINTDDKQAYTILNDILSEYDNYVKNTIS